LTLLNAGVCDAVCGQEQAAVDSKATLRLLAESGIFVDQLDGAGDWFRYHELFRCLMQRRLWSTHSAEEIDALTQRARAWQEQHGERSQVVLAQSVRQSYLPVRGEMATGNSPDAASSGAPAGPGTARDGFGAKRVVAQAAAEARAPQRTPNLPAAGQHARVLLTYREMDVLALLCERLTNKEIAYKLGVSPETVRQHTVNLYRKLCVTGRRQAIVQAQALGLMGQPAGSVQAVPQAAGIRRTVATPAGR
jgi:ATP/maltotriose-dependent transcriptional regulator MalT